MKFVAHATHCVMRTRQKAKSVLSRQWERRSHQQFLSSHFQHTECRTQRVQSCDIFILITITTISNRVDLCFIFLLSTFLSSQQERVLVPIVTTQTLLFSKNQTNHLVHRDFKPLCIFTKAQASFIRGVTLFSLEAKTQSIASRRASIVF